jgi:ketosteroid isomerase-like protein
MEVSLKAVAVILLAFLQISIVYGQKTDQDIAEIRAQRNASNAALRQFDEQLNATFSSDDALITTGAGTLLAGKEALSTYLKSQKGKKMYWVRTPAEIRVNPETKLAWESGTWKGFHEDSTIPVLGGKYSAQWTKKSGIWLIQSQLFVTLPIE